MTKRALIMGVLGLLCCPLALLAQDERRLGVDLGVSSSPRIGITYHLTPGVAVRPAVAFRWSKRGALVGLLPPRSGSVEQTNTALGLELDLLFPVVGEDVVTPYLGVGGDVAWSWFRSDVVNDGHTVWGLNGLFGVRASIIERIALYGELVLRYTNQGDVGGVGDRQGIDIGTSALGVLVYLK